MIAQFYEPVISLFVLIFWISGSDEPEGYMVKSSHQQATYEMINLSNQILAQVVVSSPYLFLSGCSQGGFVTMALLEKHEAKGVKV
ncbi:hypothetical protein DP187_21365 [Enterobacter cloacae]|nr:hypothetical protein DP187_21365 [Enterobacter cloacae]